MNLFFAEASNSDVITWGIVLVLTTIAANVAVIIGTRQKQKREVSFEFEPASKVEHDRLAADTRANFIQIRDELKQDRHDNQVHASQRQSSLFKEIKDTRVELDSKIEDTRRELAEKIDGMEGRVIATLKNTSAI